MLEKLLMIAVFICIFATIGYADNTTNATNMTNVLAPETTVGCSGRCSYAWGTVTNINWLPNMFVMTGIGNCSFSSMETGSINADIYSFSCAIPAMNITDAQEFIFHLLDNLNTEVNGLRDSKAEASQAIAEKNSTFWIAFIIIIGLCCVIGYFVYQEYW